jgi:hypothetical protein
MSTSWILFIYFLLQSCDKASSQLAAEDAQFIADFSASSPGFAAAYGSKNICDLFPIIICDDDGHLITMNIQTSLGGSIPDSIGSLPRLRRLTLYGTSLSGTIPATLANLNLTTL